MQDIFFFFFFNILYTFVDHNDIEKLIRKDSVNFSVNYVVCVSIYKTYRLYS